MVDLGECHRPSPSCSSMSGLHSRAASADGEIDVVDMTTDTDESDSAGGDCDTSGSRQSSWASISDASTRGLRDLSWIDDGDSDSDSDSDSGGAKL